MKLIKFLLFPIEVIEVDWTLWRPQVLDLSAQKGDFRLLILRGNASPLLAHCQRRCPRNSTERTRTAAQQLQFMTRRDTARVVKLNVNVTRTSQA